MSLTSIRVFAALTITLWLAAIVQQCFFVVHALQPEFTNDPRIGGFAVRYAFTSSVEVAIFALIGCTLSAFVLRSRMLWPVVSLFIFTGVVIWRFYLSGLSFYFRPPMGDGSFHRAFAGYLRVHSSLLWFHVLRASFLIASLGFWLLVCCRHRDNSTNVA